jgi:hypothetical protein
VNPNDALPKAMGPSGPEEIEGSAGAAQALDVPASRSAQVRDSRVLVRRMGGSSGLGRVVGATS